jgi:hypothetical protein
VGLIDRRKRAKNSRTDGIFVRSGWKSGEEERRLGKESLNMMDVNEYQYIRLLDLQGVSNPYFPHFSLVSSSQLDHSDHDTYPAYFDLQDPSCCLKAVRAGMDIHYHGCIHP